jgi:hypothetical protein
VTWWEDAAYSEAEAAQEQAVRDMLDPAELTPGDQEHTRQAGPKARKKRRRNPQLPPDPWA